MDIILKQQDGLKAEVTIKILRTEFSQKCDARLDEVAKTIEMPGFRTGKVPVSVVKQRMGKSVDSEILQGFLQEASAQAMKDHDLRPAVQPQIDVVKLEDGDDLEFIMKIECLPEIKTIDVSGFDVDTYEVQADQKREEEMLERLSKQFAQTKESDEGHKAKMGDVCVIDFEGFIDGIAFEGGAGQGVSVEIGSNSFIPGFEDALVGKSVGDKPRIEVSFPDDYHVETLAGQAAVFESELREVRVMQPAAIDDTLAQQLGMQSLDDLRVAIQSQISMDSDHRCFSLSKRAMLDALIEYCDFDVPAALMEMEQQTIAHQYKMYEEQGRLADEDKERTEEERLDIFQNLATRRVKLALLVAETGREMNIEVTQDEISKLAQDRAQQFPPEQYRKYLEMVEQSEDMRREIENSVLEDKVIRNMLGAIDKKPKTISMDELLDMEKSMDGDALPAPDKAKKKSAPKKKAKKAAPKKDAAPKKAAVKVPDTKSKSAKKS